jgi:formate hydrogenlyase subunit 4
LIAAIFVPWGMAVAQGGVSAYLIGAGLYVAKLAAGGFALGVFEASVAKMRVFRVSQFLAMALMLGLLGTLLLFVSRTL